jgi:tetratricopeptide (TPR) repeat protein
VRSAFSLILARPFAVAAAVILVLAAALLQLPLFNYLGYEFSAAIALLLPWVVWIPVRRACSRWRTTAESAASLGKSVALPSAGVLAIPLALGLLNMFAVKNCAAVEGLLYYLLIPGVTMIWSVTLAVWCCLMFRRAWLAYLGSLLVVFAYPLYVGYASPQIFSYNPVYGYFPGFSYDEVVRITPTLVAFRAATLLHAGLLALTASMLTDRSIVDETVWRKFALLLTPGRRPARWGAALLLFAIVAAAWAARVPLGFESSRASIEELLSARLETEHFVIRYAPGSFRPEALGWLAAMHECRFDQVRAALQVKGGGKILSYIYPDEESKRRAIGTATTNIAKPWRREIHLNVDSWEDVLKHELVHVLAGEFGMPVIRAHYHIGLVEGLAMAVDGEFGNRTLHEYAAAVRSFHLLEHPEQLITPAGFATHASSLSYVLMGSFCRFLIDRYGMVRFKDLYGGRGVERVYGKSYEQLVSDWQAFLGRTAVPEEWRAHVAYFFNRPSVFAKECVRAVAVLNEDGYRDLARHDAAGAGELFAKALAKSWNSDSFTGLVRSAYVAGRFDTLLHLMTGADAANRPPRPNLLLLRGDALWHEGDREGARRAYREALSLDLSVRFSEAAAIRLVALGDSALAAAFPSYFAAHSDSAALLALDALHSQHPIVEYLRAVIALRSAGQPPAGFERDTARFPYAVLDFSRKQMLARAALLRRDYRTARTLFWESLNFDHTLSSVERTDDWIDRTEWYERHGASYLR